MTRLYYRYYSRFAGRSAYPACIRPTQSSGPPTPCESPRERPAVGKNQARVLFIWTKNQIPGSFIPCTQPCTQPFTSGLAVKHSVFRVGFLQVHSWTHAAISFLSGFFGLGANDITMENLNIFWTNTQSRQHVHLVKHLLWHLCRYL